MMQTSQIERNWEQAPMTIRPFRSLTQQVVEAARKTIRDVPGRWTVERYDDYDGYLSVLISPESDSDGPSFLISGKLGQIEIAKFKSDELHTLGQFGSTEAALTKLAEAIGFMHPIASTMLHSSAEFPFSDATVHQTAALDASGTVSSEEQAMRLVDFSVAARRLNRPQQADQLLLRAWLAFDDA